jgi:hypothetical protein
LHEVVVGLAGDERFEDWMKNRLQAGSYNWGLMSMIGSAMQFFSPSAFGV